MARHRKVCRRQWGADQVERILTWACLFTGLFCVALNVVLS